MVKKVLVCLMLVFVTLFTFGCANVTFSVKFADGALVQEIVVDIDTGDMDVSTLTKVKNKVIDVMVGYNLNMETYWRERRAEWEVSGVEQLEEYQLLYAYYTGDTELFIENGKIILTKAYGSIYSYLFYNYPDLFEVEVGDDGTKTLKLGKNFLADVPLDSDLTQTDETFLTKYIQECFPLNYNGETPVFRYDIYKAKSSWTVYSGKENELSPTYTVDMAKQGNKLITSHENTKKPVEVDLIIEEGTTLEEAIKACFADGDGYKFSDANVKYQYKTPYKRVHSNATKVEKQDNYYVHTWDLTSFDDTITITRNYANVMIWYVIAIVATFVIVAIMFAVAFIIKKKNTPKTQEIVIEDKEDKKKENPKEDKKDKDDKPKDDGKKENKSKKDDDKKPPKNKNWIDRIYD